MDYNKNFSNFNNNSYFALTSFNPDYTNPAWHTFTQQHFNQPSMPGWSYPNQHISQSHYYNQNNHLYFSPSRWDTMPPSHIVNYLSNNHRHILLFPSNQQKKSIDWENKMKILEEIEWRLKKNSRLMSLSKISNSRSLLYLPSPTTTRRIYGLRRKYGKPDSSWKLFYPIYQ